MPHNTQDDRALADAEGGRKPGRRLSSKGALFPIELLTSKRRGGEEGRRGDEKRRERRRGEMFK